MITLNWIPESYWKRKRESLTKADYKKLQRILSDPLSPFAQVSPDQIVEYHDDPEVDGLTGATVLIDTSATVAGATLSCFTLWHWVHGGVKAEIRNITGDACSASDFRIFLEEEDQEERVFALEQMERRKIYDKRSLQAVRDMALQEEAFLLKLSLDYFEHGSLEDYYSSLEELIESGNSKQRILCYSSILQSSPGEAPPGYFDRLSRQLTTAGTFQEVDLLLKLMAERNPSSREASSQAIQLLDRDIIIARRVFWYLDGQELSESQQQRLEKIRQEKRDYL